jgi:hypothetical protein
VCSDLWGCYVYCCRYHGVVLVPWAEDLELLGYFFGSGWNCDTPFSCERNSLSWVYTGEFWDLFMTRYGLWDTTTDFGVAGIN